MKYVLNKMGVSPNQVLMIGDDYEVDIKPARSLGIKTIYLKTDNLQNSEAELVEADYIKTNYKDILRLIKKLTFNS